MIIKRLDYELNEWKETTLGEFHQYLNLVQQTTFKTAKWLWEGMLHKSGLTFYNILKDPENASIVKIREQFSFTAFNNDGTHAIYTDSDFNFYLKWKRDNPSPRGGKERKCLR